MWPPLPELHVFYSVHRVNSFLTQKFVAPFHVTNNMKYLVIKSFMKLQMDLFVAIRLWFKTFKTFFSNPVFNSILFFFFYTWTYRNDKPTSKTFLSPKTVFCLPILPFVYQILVFRKHTFYALQINAQKWEKIYSQLKCLEIFLCPIFLRIKK